MKKVVKSILSLFNLEIRRKNVKKSIPTIGWNMYNGLRRLTAIDLQVNTIVDVGAAAGTWTSSAIPLWPNAKFLMFEPLAERSQELATLTKAHSNVSYVQAAVGDQVGTVEFSVTNDLDGSGVYSGKSAAYNSRTINLTTITDEIKKLNLPGPYFIKLDTHGFEVPILKGCLPILGQIDVFVIESYGFELTDKSLLFWEMCKYMDELGFRLFDIVDVMHRQKDGAFWQCDAFFLRKEHRIFADKSYA